MIFLCYKLEFCQPEITTKRKTYYYKDKTKNQCFSPDAIDSIPKSHIFSDNASSFDSMNTEKVIVNLKLKLNIYCTGEVLGLHVCMGNSVTVDL